MKNCECSCHTEGCPKVTVEYILPSAPAVAAGGYQPVRYGNTINSVNLGWTCAFCQAFVPYGHAHECGRYLVQPATTAGPVYHVGVNVIEN